MTSERVCFVCSKTPCWNYYGSVTCDPCRFFFKKNADNGFQLLEKEPNCDGDCTVTKDDRKCKRCRLLKCLSLGMDLSKSKKMMKLENAATATGPSGKGKTAAGTSAKGKKSSGVEKKSRLSLKSSKKSSANTSGTIDAWTKEATLPDQANQTEENKEEHPLEPEPVVPCVSSLHNLGNTCFLNSVVQVLRYTPTFTEKLALLADEIKKTEKEKALVLQAKQASGDQNTEESDDGNDNTLTWDLVRHLNVVFKKMATAEERFMTGQSNYIAIRPYDLLDTVERLNPMFQGNLQQDAHEFLRCLLAYIQDASRELNKYRNQNNPDSKSTASCGENVPRLFTAPKEVELLGGCKDDGKVKVKKENGASSDNSNSKIKTRSSKRLSGGVSRDENIKNISTDVKPVVNGINGVEKVASPPGKKQGKKRRSLTELQNQDFPRAGQQTLLQCLVKKEGRKSLESSTDVPMAEVSIPKEKESGETADKTRNQNTNRLSTKRKAHDSGPEKNEINPVNADDYSQSRLPNGHHHEDPVEHSHGKLSRKRRKRSWEKLDDTESTKCSLESSSPKTEITKHSPERGTTVEAKSNSEGTDADHDNNGDKTPMDTDNSISENITETTTDNENKVQDDSQTESETTSKSNPTVIAKVKPKTAVEKKPTARKSAGGVKASQSNAEPATETPCDREAVVKLDKHGITKYFAKASQPMQLSEIERHTEKVSDCIEELFQGHVALQTRCCECETITERREEYQDISVAVRQPKDEEEDDLVEEKGEGDGDNKASEVQDLPTSTENGLNAVEQVEEEEKEVIITLKPKKAKSEEDDFEWVKTSLGEVERLRDDNKFLCNMCCHLVEAERSMHYTSVPGILTLHLKRFAMSQGLLGGFTKLTDHVPLPMMLPCIEDNCTDPQTHRLQLYGVVAHTGFTLSCGHYTSYVRAAPYHPALFDPDVVEQRPSKPAQNAPAPPSSDLYDAADPNNNQDSNNNVDMENVQDANIEASTPVESSSGEAENPPDGSSVEAPNPAGCSSEVHVEKDPVYWFECDDDLVTVLKEEDFLAKVAPGHSTTNTPYLLFYQKICVET